MFCEHDWWYGTIFNIINMQDEFCNYIILGVSSFSSDEGL